MQIEKEELLIAGLCTNGSLGITFIEKYSRNLSTEKKYVYLQGLITAMIRCICETFDEKTIALAHSYGISMITINIINQEENKELEFKEWPLKLS